MPKNPPKQTNPLCQCRESAHSWRFAGPWCVYERYAMNVDGGLVEGGAGTVYAIP
jgi:hypothetical protein